MIPRIYDDPDGIRIGFELSNGMSVSLRMSDVDAWELANIIRDKLKVKDDKAFEEYTQ